MTTTTFDTLAYSKILQKAGIPPEHADALATAQKRALDEMVAVKELATKSDIEAAKHEILKWMVTAMIAQTGLLVGIIAFLK